VKVIDCDQYTPEWWNARRGVPTASEFARIVTPAKGDYSKQAEGYICQLIADLYDPFYGQQEDYVSAAMKNGTMMEPEARFFYEMKRNVEVAQVGFCLSDCGRFGCSPDALVGDDGGLELKSPQASTQVAYLLAGGGLPDTYKPQVHGSMVVTGRRWWDFMSYHRQHKPVLVRVEWDDYTDRVAQSLDRFAGELDEAKKLIAAMRDDASASTAAARAAANEDAMLTL
jgi:hypothetical protein